MAGRRNERRAVERERGQFLRRDFLRLMGITTAAIALAACSGRPKEETAGGIAPTADLSARPKTGECKKDFVDTALIELTQAADPAAYAKEKDLAYKDGEVLVNIDTDTAKPTQFTLDDRIVQVYGGKLVTRSQTRFVMWVPLDKICGLSHEQDNGLAKISPGHE